MAQTSVESPAAVVVRRRLTDVLERGASTSVTLVAAPAGSGKTVLVRSWLETRGSRTTAVWVTAERGDADGKRFWRAVARALDDLSAVPGSAVLVLDDLHELGAPVLEQLDQVLSRPVPHVVLITRRDQPLGLHRRRVAGRLTELRAADLRFSREESRGLLEASGVSLSEESLERLHTRTEGWAAGLRLAALSLAGQEQPDEQVARFSGTERTVAQYLHAEVLDAQTRRVRRLLVRCSVLEEVDGDLGDLLSDGTGAVADLRRLAEAGEFVVAVDPARTRFRIHPLLADLLVSELRRTQPAELPGLHRLASSWYAAHGHAPDAIEHAAAAGDREPAAGLLLEHYNSLLLDGRQATAHALLARLAPVPTSVESPEMLAVLATDQLAGGSLERASAYLSLAERHAEEVPVSRMHRFEVSLFAARLSLAHRVGDVESVTAQRAAGVVTQPLTGRDIVMDDELRALTLMSLGVVEVWSGLRSGVERLEEAAALAGSIGRPYLQVECRARASYAAAWWSFRDARTVSEDVIELARSRGWGDDPVVGPALVALGAALVVAGRVGAAEDVLDRADKVLNTHLDPALGYMLHVAHANVHLARGQREAEIASYEAAERLGRRLTTGSRVGLHVWSLRLIALLSLDRADAVRVALGQLDDADRDTAEAREVRAALALHDDDFEKSLDVLQPTLDGRVAAHHGLITVRSLLLAALAHDGLGDAPSRETAVERALELAEADELVSPFLHWPCRSMLERHPRHRTAHGGFLQAVLDAMSGTARADEVVDELSEAELRVLRLMSTHLSVTDIAGQIFVSANTVKTHIKHIYVKLGAHNRSSAVEVARGRGLLGGWASARRDG